MIGLLRNVYRGGTHRQPRKDRQHRKRKRRAKKEQCGESG